MAKAGSPWKPSEIAFVKRNYKKLTNKQIAEKLGRPYGGVVWKINDLDLPNEPSYKQLQNARNTRITSSPKPPVVQTSTSTVKARPAPVKKPGFWARLFGA